MSSEEGGRRGKMAVTAAGATYKRDPSAVGSSKSNGSSADSDDDNGGSDMDNDALGFAKRLLARSPGATPTLGRRQHHHADAAVSVSATPSAILGNSMGLGGNAARSPYLSAGVGLGLGIGTSGSSSSSHSSSSTGYFDHQQAPSSSGTTSPYLRDGMTASSATSPFSKSPRRFDTPFPIVIDTSQHHKRFGSSASTSDSTGDSSDATASDSRGGKASARLHAALDVAMGRYGNAEAGPSTYSPSSAKVNGRSSPALVGNSVLPGNSATTRRRRLDKSQAEERRALARLVKMYESMASELESLRASQSELETNLKIARSNLALAENHAEVLEDTIKRHSAPRRGSSSADGIAPPLPPNKRGSEVRSPNLSTLMPGGPSDTETEHTLPSPRLGSFWRRGKFSGGVFPATAQSGGSGTATGRASPILGSLTENEAVTYTTSPRMSYDGSSEDEPQHSAAPETAMSTFAALRKPSIGMLRSSSANVPPTREDRSHAAVVLALQCQLKEKQQSYSDLEKEHSDLEASLSSVNAKYTALQEEIESLSVSLFEEANNMVAEERKANALLNDQLTKARDEVEALQIELEQLRNDPAESSTLDDTTLSVGNSATNKLSDGEILGLSRHGSSRSKRSGHRQSISSATSALSMGRSGRRRSSLPALDLLEHVMQASPRRASREMAAAAAAVAALAQREHADSVPAMPSSAASLLGRPFSASSGPSSRPYSTQSNTPSEPSPLRPVPVSPPEPWTQENDQSSYDPRPPRWFSFGYKKRSKISSDVHSLLPSLRDSVPSISSTDESSLHTSNHSRRTLDESAKDQPTRHRPVSVRSMSQSSISRHARSSNHSPQHLHTLTAFSSPINDAAEGVDPSTPPLGPSDRSDHHRPDSNFAETPVDPSNFEDTEHVGTIRSGRSVQDHGTRPVSILQTRQLNSFLDQIASIGLSSQKSALPFANPGYSRHEGSPSLDNNLGSDGNSRNTDWASRRLRPLGEAKDNLLLRAPFSPDYDSYQVLSSMPSRLPFSSAALPSERQQASRPPLPNAIDSSANNADAEDHKEGQTNALPLLITEQILPTRYPVKAPKLDSTTSQIGMRRSNAPPLPNVSQVRSEAVGLSDREPQNSPFPLPIPPPFKRYPSTKSYRQPFYATNTGRHSQMTASASSTASILTRSESNTSILSTTSSLSKYLDYSQRLERTASGVSVVEDLDTLMRSIDAMNDSLGLSDDQNS